jgi:ankyrin repeat protein
LKNKINHFLFSLVLYQTMANTALQIILNQRNSDGMTPLHYAARECSAECVMALMNSGAKVNARNCNGKSPLWLAIEAGNIPAAEALFGVNTDFSQTDTDGNTLFHLIARADNVNLLKKAIMYMNDQ